MSENNYSLEQKKRFSFKLKLSDITLSGWAIVALNAALVAGMFIFHWSPLYIVALYMVESFIIGIFNAVKLTISLSLGIPETQKQKGNIGRSMLVPFFLFHYNMFIGIQFVIFMGFVGFSADVGVIDGTLALFANTGLIGIGGLFLTHSFLFLKDYLLSGAYRQLAPDTLMMQPYGRVIIQQLVVIFGGFIGIYFGFFSFTDGTPNSAAMVYAILLMALKTFFDLLAHSKMGKSVQPIMKDI